MTEKTESDQAVHCAFREMVSIENLRPHPQNPNKHPDTQIALLAKNIRHLGWRHPVIVSELTGFVVAGHARIEAAKLLNLAEVPVDYQPFSSETDERAYLVADNRLAELAEIDAAMLNDILQEVNAGDTDTDLTGFDSAALEDLLEQFNEPDKDVDAEPQPDKADELQKQWNTKLGQVWQLGEHRLMCGDSTSEKDVASLMDGEKADMVFTDPPWNVDYGSETNGGKVKNRKILNDSMPSEDFSGFMNGSFAAMAGASKRGAMTYVVMSAQEWGRMMEALEDNEYHWSSTIIWNKDHLVLSRKDYHTKYEPIWYGWLSGESRIHPLKDRKQSDVWDIDRPTRSEEHPTMKPVELVERAIGNSSKRGSVVLDLFGGSGSTLIACEQTKRKCRMMELDPKYVAVILQRYQDATDDKPKLA